MEPLIAGPLNAQCGKCLYWEQNENGGKGPEVTMGWDIKKNTEM